MQDTTEADPVATTSHVDPSSPTPAPGADTVRAAGSPHETRPDAASRQRNWVPIRSLASRHRERILKHLVGLDERSRYLRFGYAATDSHISRYVDTIDFDHDEVFGIFNRRLELIALAHLAFRADAAPGSHEAAGEFGVSVLDKARRHGFGRRLFEHAVLHARNRGVQALFIHALSENTAMLRIARDAGAEIVRDGSESEAWLKLAPETLGSHIDELVGEQLAEFDYRLKHQAHLLKKLFKRSGDPAKRDG